jgi:hypothetical protein
MEKFTLKTTNEAIPDNYNENSYTVAIKRSFDGKTFFLESPHYNGGLGFTDNSADALLFDSYFLANMFFKATKEALKGSEDQAILCAVTAVDDKISEFTFL